MRAKISASPARATIRICSVAFPPRRYSLPIYCCTAIFPGSHFPSCPCSLRNMVSYAAKRILRLRLIFAKQPYYGHDAAARRPSTKPHLLRFCMVQIPQSSVRRHSSVCFCTRAAALAATLGSLYRNPPSCAREKTRHAPATGKPRHAHARVRFRKKRWTFPRAKRASPGKNGTAALPKPFPVAEKGRNRLFSAFAPPKTILYNIYHTARPLQNGPAGSRSAPHPPAPAAGALSSFRTRKHRKHCLDFSPAKGSGRSHAPAEFLLLKHANRMRRKIQLSSRCRQASHC